MNKETYTGFFGVKVYYPEDAGRAREESDPLAELEKRSLMNEEQLSRYLFSIDKAYYLRASGRILTS